MQSDIPRWIYRYLMRHLAAISALLVIASPATAFAEEAIVAVAANFTKPAEALGRAFTEKTGGTVTFSFGSTGSLYAQITQGAPFEVFLSGDSKRPNLAIKAGLGIEGTAFTYAVGALALYAPHIDVTHGKAVLADARYQHLAIADPLTAPYGAAAVEALEKLGLTETTGSKLVVGENISQALQFVDSGNAELGFVALSQVIDKPANAVWRVPAHLHGPILQDAVLLAPGANDPTAKAFLDFIRSNEGKVIIEKFGYSVP